MVATCSPARAPTTEAVVLDPAFSAFGAPDDTYYQGDAVELTVHADVDHDVTYGMTADRQGFQELIGALRAAGEGDGSDDRALLESALDLVNAALPRITGYQSEIGASRAALDRINLGHGDAELYLESQISDIENVDLSEAITRLAQDQMVIESVDGDDRPAQPPEPGRLSALTVPVRPRSSASTQQEHSMTQLATLASHQAPPPLSDLPAALATRFGEVPLAATG